MQAFTQKRLLRITAAGTRRDFFRPARTIGVTLPVCVLALALAAQAALARPGRGRPKPPPPRQDQPATTETGDRELFPTDRATNRATTGDANTDGAGGDDVFGPRDVPTGVAGWSIVLGGVAGDDLASAQRALDSIRMNGVPEARLENRARGRFVVVGSYADPTAPEVRRELQRVRSIVIDGRLPYLFSFLSPPPKADLTGSTPEHDLRLARRLFGEQAIYTLQVGIYGRTTGGLPTPEELRQFRRAAEQAVARLRAEGEAAFYYHDTYRSSVTVGVFGTRDHDPSVRPALESFSLIETRKRFPNNLLNGEGILETVRNSSGVPLNRLQSSVLVAIPEE